MASSNKFSKYNRKFIDDRVDFAKVLETFLIGFNNIALSSSPDQTTNFINAVEQLYTMATPLLSDEQFKEIEQIEKDCNEEVKSLEEERNYRIHKLSRNTKKNEIKRKYSERKSRKLLLYLKPVLISESITAVEDDEILEED